MRKFLLIITCLAFIYMPLKSHAWGVEGHRVVGEIADHYLTPKAKAAIKNILGFESVAIASNWADFIKSDTNYRYLSTWHWIDFPKGLNYRQLQQVLNNDTAKDAYTAINFLTTELKKQ